MRRGVRVQVGRELARHRQEWVAKRQVRYDDDDIFFSGDRHGPKATRRPKALRPKLIEDNDTFVEW